MELMASGSIKFYRLPSIYNDPSSSSPTLFRNSTRKSPSPLTSKFKGSQVYRKRIQLGSVMVTAFTGDKNAVANNSVTEKVLIPEQPLNANHEAPKSGEGKEAEDLAVIKRARACDRLIEVFMVDKPTPAEWRRLLVFSKSWTKLRPHFFNRCQERAENEQNPDMQAKLYRLARKLREIDADVERHNELLQVIRSGESQLGDVVDRRRKDFTKEFFMHLHTVVDSYYDNPTEQKELANLGNACLDTVQAYDVAAENLAALDTAELQFQDILNSPSPEDARRKIDALAGKGQMDPAFASMINKAWATNREVDLTVGEAKDQMHHMYLEAKDKMKIDKKVIKERAVPKEIRILKHLLRIEDRDTLLSTLNDAFTPGEETEGKHVEYFYTEPEKLYNSIKMLVDAYKSNGGGALLQAAKRLMKPRTVKKMEEMMKIIRREFL